METTRCTRCNRRITAKASVVRGYGKGCAAKIKAAEKLADLAAFTASQLDAARELITDLAIIPLRARRVWLAVSSDGTRVYRTANEACSCPAGIRSVRCLHRAAVAILNAA